jgi:hypothetical protein
LVYFGWLGIVLLWTVPGTPAKVFGVICLILAVLLFINIRGDRKAARIPAQTPAPYINLQAAMARLHETDDKHNTVQTPEK